MIHQKDDDDDFADVKFITMSKETANEEIQRTKDRAIKVMRLRCVIEREDYILCKSLDQKRMLETFYVERVLIIKGEKYG